MRSFVVVACVLGGCASVPMVSSESHDDDIAVPTPAIAHATYSVVGAELGDAGAVDRIRARARLVRHGRASPKRDDEPIERHPQDVIWRPILPVVGESAERIRVVASDDHARVAVWIDRADVAPSVRADIQLADERGRARRNAGVWLEAGAPIEVAHADMLGGMQRIALHDPSIRAGGWVEKSLVGDVWVARTGDRRPTAVDNTAWFDVGDGAQGVSVLAGAIRIAPHGDAKVIADVLEPVDATVVRRSGDWAEVDVRRPYARIHGFVPASRVGTSDQAIHRGGGLGIASGGSDSARIDVGPGVCLYDEHDGEVIGVNLDKVTRTSSWMMPGWWEVQLATRWGGIQVTVRELTGTRDPTQVQLETCTR